MPSPLAGPQFNRRGPYEAHSPFRHSPVSAVELDEHRGIRDRQVALDQQYVKHPGTRIEFANNVFVGHHLNIAFTQKGVQFRTACIAPPRSRRLAYGVELGIKHNDQLIDRSQHGFKQLQMLGSGTNRLSIPGALCFGYAESATTIQLRWPYSCSRLSSMDWGPSPCCTREELSNIRAVLCA